MSSDLFSQFQQLDLDGSGTLTASEILSAMTDGDIQNAKDILQMMDIDMNGDIDYLEFVRFYEGDAPQASDALANTDSNSTIQDSDLVYSPSLDDDSE